MRHEFRPVDVRKGENLTTQFQKVLINIIIFTIFLLLSLDHGTILVVVVVAANLPLLFLFTL